MPVIPVRFWLMPLLLSIACTHAPPLDTSTFCGAVQDIAHSASADFKRVRVDRETIKKGESVWPASEPIPGAGTCKVTQKAGWDEDRRVPNEAVYSCETPPAACEQLQGRFDQLTHELESCLDSRPERTVEQEKRIAQLYYRHSVSVQAVFTGGANCGLALTITPTPAEGKKDSPFDQLHPLPTRPGPR
jgi:hypothetical protein